MTAVEDESIVGFPPLVLQALRDALKQDETAVSKGELKPNTSPSSWAQERVLKAALPILRDYLETDEVAGLFEEESESSPTLPAASGAESSTEIRPTDLKVKKKRKLADQSTTEEEERKGKKKSNKKKKRKEG